MDGAVRPLTKLRAGLLALSFVWLALGHLLLGASLWLGIDDELFAFLQPLACLVPLFCELNFQRYFGIALALIVLGVLGIIVSAGQTLNLPPERDLSALPGALQFVSRSARRGFLVLLALSVLATAGFAVIAVTPPGNPPPLLWLALIVLVGATFDWADRAAGRRSLMARQELVLTAGYVAFLLLLAFAYRDPVLRVAAILIVLSASIWLWRKRPAMREMIGFALVVMGAFAVYTFDLMSWRYAFIGDEYAFFEFANNIINGIARPYVLSPMGAYDVHPVFATFIQVTTITLFGNDVYGWRISETLAVMLAALLLYVTLRAFVNARAALLALMVFLASQHLLGITKVGYTYSQLFVPLLGSLALFVLAVRRGSLLGLFLSGSAAAFAFYTFAFGIPFIVLPVLMFGVCWLIPRSQPTEPVPTDTPPPTSSRHPVVALRATMPAAAALILGIGLTAMPSLSDTKALERIAVHTVAHSEVRGANNLTEQVIPNLLYTLSASLSFQGHSHYVYGAHLDPLSSILMLLGAAALLATLRRSRLAIWLLATFLLVCLFTGGFAPYPYPPIARTYILIPFYALFAAFGASQAFAWLAASRAARLGIPVWMVLMAAIPSLNLYQFFVLTDQHNPQEQVAMVVREFQTQPADENIYVVERAPFNFSVTRMVLRAYHINADRLRAITDENATGGLAAMLRSGSDELLINWDSAARDRWRSTYRQLWPDQNESIISDASGIRHYVRLALSGRSAEAAARATPAGTQSGKPFVVSAGTNPQVLTTWSAERPRDLALAPDGTAYVINAAQQSVEVHAQDGRFVRALPGSWREPFALAFNSRQQLLVLDAGAKSVTLLREDGTLVARSDPDMGLSSPRGLAVDANDDVYVADTGNARIVRFNAELLSPETWPTRAPFQQPTSLAFVGERVAVADGPWMYVLARSGEVSARWKITGYNTVEPPHLLPGQAELIVMTDPEAGEIVVYDLEGRLVLRAGPPAHERLLKPLGIAATSDGRVYISEYEGNLVHVFDWNGP